MTTITTPTTNPLANTPSLWDEAGPDRDSAFDTLHPGVYAAFSAIARETRAAGFQHYSARTIIHVMRHHRAVSMGPGGEFKIDNRVSPYLARRLLREDRTFEGFFEFRKSREDD